MAEKVGLTAVLSFLGDRAIAGMQRAGRAFHGMAASARVAKAGVQDIKAGFAGMNMATLALAGAGGMAVKKFTDFERQFGAVKAVLGEQASKFFPELQARAEELGATTGFAASEAAAAMENLARAGLAPKEILSAIKPTLSAAAAEGIGLATTADIVASNMRAFGLEAKDATRIADTLAYVSAKTNTNMVGLQEGMKFVAPISRQMGISIEDTAASLGLLADVGLKGSLAGTGLKNALLKLAKSAKDGKVKVGKFNAEIIQNRDETGKIIGLNLPATMKNVVSAMNAITDPMKKANAGMKLLGLRGIGASTAFDAMSESKADILFNDMAKSAKGSAAAMEKMRLANIYGDLITLQSAAEAAAIKIGGTLAPTVRKAMTGMSKFMGDAAKSFQAFTSGNTEGLSKLNQTSVEFVRGFKEGFSGAKEILLGFVGVVKRIVRGISALLGQRGMLGEDGPGVRGVTAFAMKFAAFSVGLKVTLGLMSRFGRVAVGTFKLVAGAVGAAKTGLMGSVTLLSKKIPALKALPGVAGRLSRLAGAAEKITAQPVRVVNFDEAIGFGGMGGRGLPGGGPTLPGGKGKKGFLNMHLGDIGKTSKGTTAALQGLGTTAGVAAAAFAGWQIGRAIDETFGLSEAFSDLAKESREAKAARRIRERESQAGARVYRARAAAQQFGAVTKGMGGFGYINRGKGKREALTREMAMQEIRKKFLQAGGRLEKLPEILAELKPALDKIPTKEEFLKAERPLQLKVVLDGKIVARSTSEKLTDIVKRGGKFKHKPGTNREKTMGFPFTP